MREMYALTRGRAVIFRIIEAVVPPPCHGFSRKLSGSSSGGRKRWTRKRPPLQSRCWSPKYLHQQCTTKSSNQCSKWRTEQPWNRSSSASVFENRVSSCWIRRRGCIFINTFAAAYRHAMQGSSAIFSPYHRGGGDTTQGQFHANEPIGYGDETFLMTNTTCVLFVRLLCCSPPPNSCFCTIFFCRAVESPVQRAYTASYSSGTN